jgi:carnitine 3-dehydrogenase
VHAGALITIRTRVVMGAGKKMHLFHEMYEADRLLATGEHFLLHVNLSTRKPSPPAPHVEAALVRFAQGHAELPLPEGLGRAIGAPR